jgi:uncharacterized membrane protein YkvI
MEMDPRRDSLGYPHFWVRDYLGNVRWSCCTSDWASLNLLTAKALIILLGNCESEKDGLCIDSLHGQLIRHIAHECSQSVRV